MMFMLHSPWRDEHVDLLEPNLKIIFLTNAIIRNQILNNFREYNKLANINEIYDLVHNEEFDNFDTIDDDAAQREWI